MNTQKAPYRHADGSNCWTKDCRLGNTLASSKETFENWIPKSAESVKGGWLRNSKPSQYVTRVAMRLFGVDESTVVSTLKELEHEGRHLPPVSGEVAMAFVDEESAKTADSNEIDEHERVILLNKLQKAREQVKNGVSGSHFYAWKNAVARVGLKLRKFAVIGLLAPTLALSSCSAGDVTPSPSTSPSSSPTTSQTVSPSPTQTTPASSDTIAGSGQTATDKYGKYEFAAPVKPIVNSEGVDPSAKEVGFSSAQIKSAQDWVGNFVSTQAVDSSTVDGDEATWQAWVKANSSKYLVKEFAGALVKNKNAGERSSLIFNNPKDAITPFARDGGVRISSEKLYVDSVEGAVNDAGVPRLQISGSADVTYRVSPEQALAALKKARPSASDAELKKAFPKAFNSTEDKLTLNFSYIYSVRLVDGDWKIAGYSNTFHTAYGYN